MGTGQTLMTVAAIMLLGTIILTTNKRIASTDQVMRTANYGIEQVALATKIIQEAQAKSFDQTTQNGNNITGPSSFSSSLGQESGSTDFDDFDDYNGVPGGTGLVMKYDSLATGDYCARTTVRYVMLNTATGTLDTTSTPQWWKRIDVWVWNTVTPNDVVHMHAIKTYW